MSITDELREIAVKTECASGRCEKLYRGDLEHIADRIDAEHEQQMAERRRSCVFYDAERNYCKVHDEGDMAELGYVRLPVDTDGVPIRIGERVQLIGNDPSTVSHMSLADDGWRVYVKYDGGIGTGSGEPKRIRHYHAPTVEDVLREFFSRYVTTKPKDEDDAIIAEYAAKLRLAGDAE